MTRALIITIALLIGSLSSAWAYHVIEQIEDAYELSLGLVTLPTNSDGSVIFTACESCRTTSLRVTDATRYLVNGSQAELSQINEIAGTLRGSARGREETAVIVFYDPRSLRVTRISLSYRDR